MALSPATLSKIHIAKQQLGMDDHSYRCLLARISGVSSSKDLSTQQASSVLKEFERLGWKPRPSNKATGKPRNFDKLPNQIKKIEALLADMKLPWAYANAVARQMFRVQQVTWLRKSQQLDAIIAALHVEQEKRWLLADIHRLLDLLGEDKSNRHVALEQLPDGWERQRPILRHLVETLGAAVDAREAT